MDSIEGNIENIKNLEFFQNFNNFTKGEAFKAPAFNIMRNMKR